MKANPYDWMNQSRAHRAYGERAYPVMSAISRQSNGYPAFAMSVQGLPNDDKRRYAREWNSWNRRFGIAWNRMGCMKENSVGQFTDRYRVTTQARHNRTLGAFDTSVGDSDRPPAPVGHNVYPVPPDRDISYVSDWLYVPGYPLWISRAANVKGYKGVSYIYVRTTLTDQFLTSSGKATPITVEKPPADQPYMPPAEEELTYGEPVESTATAAVGAGVPTWVWLLGGGALVAFGLSRMKRKKGKR